MYHLAYQRLRISWSELKVLRPQVVRDTTEKESVPHTPWEKKEGSEDEARPKKELRREIKKWW